MLQPIRNAASWAGSVRTWRFRRVTAALVVLMLLAQFAGRVPSVAFAYSCPDSGNHCFGIVSWLGAIDGAATEITMRGLHYAQSPGFMNNEIWLIGHQNSGQPPCYFGGNQTDCWVETGNHIGTFYTGDNPNGTSCSPDRYWWADNRPSSNKSTNYHDHFVAPIPQGDYLKPTLFELTDGGQGTWAVYISGSTQDVWTDRSTGNYMTTNNSTGSFQIGGELADHTSSGASAPPADYTYTEFRDAANNWYFQYSNGYPNGGWYDLPGDPSGPDVGNSVWSTKWVSYPSNDQRGGDWQTFCTC